MSIHTLCASIAGLIVGLWPAAPLMRAILAAPASADETSARPSFGLAVGGRFEYEVVPGDSLTRVGARFGVEPATLARRNGLAGDAWLRPRQRLSIDNTHIAPPLPGDGIWINVPQRMLFRIAQGRVQQAFPVGLGRPTWPTPLGDFTVRERQQDKVWLVPPSIQREMEQLGTSVEARVPPGPDNPLGRHWIGLSLPGIGIHGTIAPASIYHFQTHGCVRLQPEAAAELHAEVALGERGAILYQPVLLARLEDQRILLEVHRDAYRRAGDPLQAVHALAAAAGVEAEIDWVRAEAVVREHAGIAEEVQRSEPPGEIER